MVTVATTLDVPIKLTFEAATRKSILGLGDLVIPGMVMGWALRLDLWLHYQRKVKYEATELKIVEKDASTGAVVTRSETKHKEIKARYVDVQGRWADNFWIRALSPFGGPKQVPSDLADSRFPKRYFYATMAGYTLGMGVTLAMLLIFRHGQPALLYLVPGVLGSLYLTAIARGELKQVWSYTEDGSIDTVDVIVDVDSDGNAVKRLGKLKDGVLDITKNDDDKKKDDTEDKSKEEKDKSKDAPSGDEDKKAKKGHPVFLLSLETPAEDDRDD